MTMLLMVPAASRDSMIDNDEHNSQSLATAVRITVHSLKKTPNEWLV
jgi:hypothetical protein